MNKKLDQARAELDAIREVEKLDRSKGGLGTTWGLGDIERPESYVEIDETGGLHIYWGGYDYPIGLDEIHSPTRLLGLIMHISDKTWPLMNPNRIASLINLVCREKGWDPHTG